MLKIRNTRHLYQRLNFNERFISAIIEDQASLVKEIKLVSTKKDGTIKERTVFNTEDHYKILLKKINKEFLRNIKMPQGVMGGVHGKSIKDMAIIHCGKESVFSIDLKDFYPSINKSRVKTAFLKKLMCSPEVSHILTELVTFNGSLPQGFPTSTMLANIIATDLDIQHLSICEQVGVSRTRWVDDIVFSGRKSDLQKIIRSSIGAVKKHHFKISNKKTEFQHKSETPVICGLRVDGKEPKVPDEVINRTMELLQTCISCGVDIAQQECPGKSLKDSLIGTIRYISKFNPEDANNLIELMNKIKW